MRRFKVCRRRISRISIGSILDLGGSLEECPFLLLLFLDLLVFLVFLLGVLAVLPMWVLDILALHPTVPLESDVI